MRDAMSVWYRLIYSVGFTPWEKMASLPAAKQIDGLFDREQEGREPPYGKALDLGCGSGIWSVNLAQRGWDVTGVDNVDKAVRRARERAQQTGVEARFAEADVTVLGAAGVGDGFRLLLDFGMIHGLSEEQRAAAAREITSVAGPDAALLILAFPPARRGPLPRGMSHDEITAAFREWETADQHKLDTTGAPRPVRKAGPTIYRLRLRG